MELEIDVKKDRDLSEREYEDVLSLCSRAFETDYRVFLDTFHGAAHVLGYYENRLVSHALWITRWLQAGDRPLMRTAYVEGVATEEACRNRGFASAVMTRLGKEIVGFDLGGLCTGYLDFYSRFGWRQWKGPLFIRRDGGLVPTPAEIVMVLLLPDSPPLDLTASLSAEWREGELW